jgi:hypothetical protein
MARKKTQDDDHTFLRKHKDTFKIELEERNCDGKTIV